MKTLLKLSLVLNTVLLCLYVLQSPKSSAAKSTVSRTNSFAHSVPLQTLGPESQASRSTNCWEFVESKDPSVLVANLRAVGCPEPTIRDIVVLRVSREFRNRLVASEAQAARQWNFLHPAATRDWRERNAQRMDLRNEMISTIESVLDGSWAKLSAATLGWPERGEQDVQFLSTEKRRRLRELDQRYSKAKADLDLGPGSLFGPPDAEDLARSRQLDEQKAAELAEILSPLELEEYRYRTSQAANYVRNILPTAKSESEFRIMVKVATETKIADEESSSPLSRYGLPGSKEESRGPERKAAFDARLKEALGEARVIEQQAEEQQRQETANKRNAERQSQKAREEMVQMAAKVGIAESDATRFFNYLEQMQPELGPKFEQLEKTLSGTPEENAKKMKALVKIELERIAAETLGPKGKDLVQEIERRDKGP